MSKSTPLSQLPSLNGMPSNNNDIMLEEDPTVQEMMNTLDQPLQQTQQPMMDANQLRQIQQQNMIANATNNNVMQTPMMPPQAMFMQQPMGNPSDFVMQPPVMFNGGLTSSKFFVFDGELKSVLLVVILAFAVQVIPMEQLVFKYVPVENVPYSQVVIKAVVAGVAFFFLRRYL